MKRGNSPIPTLLSSLSLLKQVSSTLNWGNLGRQPSAKVCYIPGSSVTCFPQSSIQLLVCALRLQARGVIKGESIIAVQQPYRHMARPFPAGRSRDLS